MLIAVRDAGTGIDPDNANRLFSAFCSTKPNGMGMGLSICRICAANNADGSGADIMVTLPSHDPQQA